MNKKTVIAIDGPAASGKGTLARRIAERFGLKYLDTGSLYRATALKVLENKIEPAKAAENLTLEDTQSPNLRNEEVGNLASKISALPEVRKALLDFQRNFANSPPPYSSPLEGEGWVGGAVLDGRDIGTVVCPDADIKLYITASTDVRAERRAKELGVDIEAVKKDLIERDRRDAERAASPLKPADDALIVDTSDMNIEEVFDKVVEIIKNRCSL